MSDRMTCPGCDGRSSAILRAYEEERPCPDCGLSSDAAAEITEIRETRANTELKTRLTAEIRARSAAELKVRQLEYRLEEIRNAVNAPDPDWLTGR